MYWFNKYRSYLKSPQAYYYFLEKTDLSRFPALQIGAIDKLEEADESGLYQWMEDYPLLLRQYPLQDCAQGADDFHTALRVMDWLSAHTHYCGLQFRLIPDRTPQSSHMDMTNPSAMRSTAASKLSPWRTACWLYRKRLTQSPNRAEREGEGSALSPDGTDVCTGTGKMGRVRSFLPHLFSG